MENELIIIEEAVEYSDATVNAVRALTLQLGDGSSDITTADIKEIIESKTTSLYLAKLKSTEEIVGMITLSAFRIPYKRRAWVDDVVVDENYRGRGFGVALLKHAIKEAKSKHVGILDLTSRPSRESANKLYISLGFEKRETNVYRINL